MSTTRPSALVAGILAMLLVATVAAPTVAADPEQKYRFVGYGTDHGVGLSQRGAGGRAKAGQTYDQILLHYFRNVRLKTDPPAVPQDTTIRALVVQAYRAGTGKTTLVQGGNFCTKRDKYGVCVVRERSRWTFDTPGVGDLTFPYSYKLVLIGRGASGDWVLEVQDRAGATKLRVTDTNARLTVRSIPADGARGRLQLNIRSSTKYDTFEGVLRIGRVGGRIRVVNIVPIEPFVRSVTPSELGPSNYEDALKAQAVVARSYFLAGRNPSTTGFLTYDVQSYKDSHSYRGSKGENKVVTQAVDETAYQVLEYKKTDGWFIARTFYHARGGGATEASMNVFTTASGKPGTRVKYLMGDQDVDEDGRPYDMGSNFEYQTKGLTLDQLSAILAKDSRTDVGKLTSWPIEPESTFRSKRAAALLADVGDPTPDPENRGVSGRLTWVVLRGTKNGEAVKKQVAGWLFKSVYNAHNASGDPDLGSTLFFRSAVD